MLHSLTFHTARALPIASLVGDRLATASPPRRAATPSSPPPPPSPSTLRARRVRHPAALAARPRVAPRTPPRSRRPAPAASPSFDGPLRYPNFLLGTWELTNRVQRSRCRSAPILSTISRASRSRTTSAAPKSCATHAAAAGPGRRRRPRRRPRPRLLGPAGGVGLPRRGRSRFQVLAASRSAARPPRTEIRRRGRRAADPLRHRHGVVPLGVRRVAAAARDDRAAPPARARRARRRGDARRELDRLRRARQGHRRATARRRTPRRRAPPTWASPRSARQRSPTTRGRSAASTTGEARWPRAAPSMTIL